MKKYDMHVHAQNTPATPEKLIEKLEKSGMYGCNIFSSRPIEADARLGMNFCNRIEQLHQWTDNHRDRLFPVLWIHPDEKNIKKKIRTAVNEGAEAFKVICTNFYPYEKKCMRMLEAIADEGKPVIFHSGILWNGAESSKYNRPLNFERLIEIDGLRFSLGHCSWPWVDECIALYGKFLNGTTSGRNTEMFFDLTPGTPTIYREELLTKLFTVGYDVPDNIIFGTDNRADSYNSDWAEKWLKTDGSIYDKLGVSDNIRKKIYSDNLLRFLGKIPKSFTHLSPVPDRDTAWSLENERSNMEI
jgi:predicted TIM-barrel fold metal-dependent hydrolase